MKCHISLSSLNVWTCSGAIKSSTTESTFIVIGSVFRSFLDVRRRGLGKRLSILSEN